MNTVKKISIVFMIMILMICMFTNKTFAALNCNVNLSASKNTITYKEQFSVYVSIANLQTTKGIIAIGAVVSYDTDYLTLVDIEGQNKWSDPFHNASNGKITSFKSELSNKNENVFKITFKAKEKAKKNAWIKISNFEISDGEAEKNCGGSSINIAIEEKSSGNSSGNNQGGSTTQKPSTKPGDSNQNSGSTQTNKPSTGTTKPTGSGVTNVQGGNVKNETTSDKSGNQVQENNIENVVGEDVTNNEIQDNNNLQNTLEGNTEEVKEDKKISKGLFYTISIVAVVAIIGILFVIIRYWKASY